MPAAIKPMLWWLVLVCDLKVGDSGTERCSSSKKLGRQRSGTGCVSPPPAHHQSSGTSLCPWQQHILVICTVAGGAEMP